MSRHKVVEHIKSKKLLSIVLCGVLAYSALHFDAFAQYVQSKLLPPPPVPEKTVEKKGGKEKTDSISLHYKASMPWTLILQKISPQRPNMMPLLACISYALSWVIRR